MEGDLESTRPVVPGSMLANKYRLVHPLGRGGMGQVWRAQDVVLGAFIAIKLIEPDLLAVDESRQEVVGRFLTEAQAAAALRSPHVVQILEFGIDGRVPFIAMELLEGETLDVRLARVRALPYADTARVLTHVGRAMARAHELGIIHRDLKPANVFLSRNDDEEIAKVMDFGIAKRTGPMADRGAHMTRTGRVVGTPAYMSPEQMLGDRLVDGQCDLWAMAVMAFECVCGSRPFDAETHGQLTLQICTGAPPVPSKVTRVPPGFDAWFERATRRDPTRRFANAKELTDTLRAVLLQPNLGAPEVSMMRPAAGPPDTQQGIVTGRTFATVPGGAIRAVALAGVSFGVVACAIAVGAFLLRHRSSEAPAAASPAVVAEGAGAPSASTVQPAPSASSGDAPAPSSTDAPAASADATTPPTAEPSADATAEPSATGARGRPKGAPHAKPAALPRRRDPRLGF